MQPTMRPLAQAIQAQGRGNDSMLVHMTPREVGGLQALALAHGGSLTINPETGLPEAGFLDSLLPTLLGVGLSFIPGVGPLMAAGIVGGGTALATGDIGKGLMAGLGAYGGAGLGASLSAAGAAGAGGAGATGIGEAFQAAQSNIDPALLESMSAQQVAQTMPVAAQTQLMGQGAQNLFASGATGEAARTAFMDSSGGVTGLAKTGLSAAAPAILGAPAPITPIEPEKSNYAGPYKPQPRTVRYPGADRARDDSSEFTYFSPMNPYPGFVSAAGGGEIPSYEEGGIAALANKKMPPRFLSGGGDGMSDSIPAVINDKQPARLADGEFVVPADVVSHIGNGSSKAGAKKLYGMMDRVRKSRTGKTRQAPEVNMNRMMPA